ncbi:hypothetical protein [Aquibium sp. ELW1220]|uniref:hypothetical protein n=1 Tax=Aquibium sp. ELW1220 TaxID=2976766 RepID=UPI0025AF8FD1|nr:hypothetical protein [Aquibium sp. ELW1220]MDN2584315.1 hypothetical protein [Aquibium sp. ELW1220]
MVEKDETEQCSPIHIDVMQQSDTSVNQASPGLNCYIALESRILEIRGSRESGVSAGKDHDWHNWVTLEIGPHPALSETQAKVIALDYGMRGGKAEIKVRRALLYYALRRLGLDTDPAARQPRDQQIVLLNRDAVHLHDGSSAQ